MRLLFFFPSRYGSYRRSSIKVRLLRRLYALYTTYVRITKKNRIISSVNSINKPWYLDHTDHAQKNPSSPLNDRGIVYLEGWLFRNPEGIKKYRSEISDYFAPHVSILEKVKSVVNPLRAKFKHVVGVHIRHGDYAGFKNGIYYISFERVVETLKEYLHYKNINKEETVFIIASDETVPREYFYDMNIHITNGSAGEDMFILAATDVIIGSDSSFGNLAAYFGNIPHIIISKEQIDWKYYDNKKSYFPTKYCSMVHY